MHHVSRLHERRLRVIPASVSAWLALCAATSVHAQDQIIIGPGNYGYSQKFNNISGLIVGSTTIDPRPPYPAQLGGAGVTVEPKGSAVIDPDAGSQPGNVTIYSHYVSGAPNDGLYVSGGTLTINGSSHGYGTYVSTDGQQVHGIYAPYSGSATIPTTLDATNLYITTAGNSADGIRAYGTTFGAPVITLRDSSITTSSGFTSAYGVRAYPYSGTVGPTINLINTKVSALGTSTYGIASSASTINLTNGSVSTVAPSAYTTYIYNASTLTANGTLFASSGASGIGLYESGASTAALMNAQFSTTGDNAHGIYDTASTLAAQGGSIKTTGSGALGIWLTNGATATLNGTGISTGGATAYGIYLGNSASLDMQGGGVTTAGGTAHGVWVTSGSTASIEGVTISTSGTTARGVYVNGAGSSATLTNDQISTTGSQSYGVHGTTDAIVTIQGGSVSTTGPSAYATWFANTVQATLNGTAISSMGSNAYGLLVGGLSASASATGVTIKTTGAGAAGYYVWTTGILQAYGGSVSTSGANAAGVVVDGLSSATLARDASGAGTSVTTSGSGSHAVRVTNGGTLSATGASLHATGDNSNGVYLSGAATASVAANSNADTPPATPSATLAAAFPIVRAAAPLEYVALANTTVQADKGAGILVAGGVANVSLTGSTVTGASAALDATTASVSSALSVNADSSTLNGAVLTDTGSTTTLNLANSSRWNVTGDSTVTTLANANSLIDFEPSPALGSAPTSASSYRVVNVSGNYSGAQGTVAVNTWLNAGGSLSAQSTDRLLIAGNASGVTYVDVKPVPGSPGGLTAPTGVIGPSEGISVVQVAGSSTQGAFRLAGGYVVAPESPYEYALYAYGPQSSHGGAEDAQQLVGSGGSHWDYRLQSVYVTPDGPVDPVDPGQGPLPPSPAPEEDVQIPSNARPAVAPQVAAYLAAPAAFLYSGLVDIDSLHRRLGEIRDDADLGRDGGPSEMFFRAYGGDFNYSSNIGFQQFGYNMSGDYSAIQFGANAFKFRNDNGLWRFGLAGSVGWLHFQPEAVDGPSSSRSNIYRLSGYGTYQSRQGWYFDGILSVGWLNGDVDTTARGQTMKLQGNSYAASVEAGYPFTLPYRINIEPQIQLVGQHLSFHNSLDADDLDINIGSQNQLTGRLGVRVTRPFDVNAGRVTPYAEIDVLHSFAKGTAVQVSDVQFTSGQMGDALQYSLGINGTYTTNLSLYGRVSYQQQIGNGGFRGWLVNGGARYVF
ncbi:autotransporter outer membrane beta-barrel domain-containing protein [Paraburkholderia sp. CNPSo 3272]|uniref:autotransporter outer membrane beta-barrel domain-containing protein n=1 Tax=Paraburkholderia sp. CNPSo 3272 TaxID=2940931 RepID=UPI0020B7941C|nr:autotransporter outer membrane beta-barrel domain-containing protein [Paraburkholderia sp. CNPSo 3272]MCP3727569.1 autotransporter outer membrane beta-barrel domain-containing protein [Paraburkholderia sp. CNPSo 3272]